MMQWFDRRRGDDSPLVPSMSQAAPGAGPPLPVRSILEAAVGVRLALVHRGGYVGVDVSDTHAASRCHHLIADDRIRPPAGMERTSASATKRNSAGTRCCRVGGRRLDRAARAGPTDLVSSRRRIESGRGQACPGPSHTTRHAGPHRAVRSAFPETAVGVGEPFQASGLVPVGVRQGALEWPGSGDAPVALLRCRP